MTNKNDFRAYKNLERLCLDQEIQAKVCLLCFREKYEESLTALASALGSISGSVESMLAGFFFELDETTRNDALLSIINT